MKKRNFNSVSRSVRRPIPFRFENLESRTLLAADLANATGDDLAIRADSEWWVDASTGDQVQSSKWGTSSGVTHWTDIQVADVDGNDLDDLVGRTPNGTLWVARSTGNQFIIEPWGSWSGGTDWEHVGIGDFNGDGLADLVGFNEGEWQVSGSTGSSLINEIWGKWADTGTWQDVSVADVNGDGLDDNLAG